MGRPNIAASMIPTLTWPSAEKNTNGLWYITWNITLVDDRHVCRSELDEVARRCDDNFFGFWVTLDHVSARQLRAVVTTAHWSMDDPYYVLTYRMLAVLDAELGPISSIEDQPMERWRPFRSGEPSSPEHWDNQVRRLRAWVAERAAP